MMPQRTNAQPSTGDTIDSPADVKLTGQLVLQLISTASEVADEVRKMREELAMAETARKELAGEVRCLAAGVKRFQADYGPFLEQAVASQKAWRARRNEVLVHMLKWGAIWAAGVILMPWERIIKLIWP